MDNEIEQNNNILYIDNNILAFIIVFIIIILFILRLLIPCFFITRNEQNIRYINSSFNDETPIIKFNKVSERLNDICSICLEPLDKKITMVNCKHIFHKKCIHTWINEFSSINYLYYYIVMLMIYNLLHYLIYLSIFK